MTSLLQVVGYIGTLIVGGLIGSFITNRLTIDRERQSAKEKRLLDFHVFIVEFKSEAAEGHFRYDVNPFAEFYLKKKPELRSAAAKITDDLPRNRRDEFDRLVNAAAGFNNTEAARNRVGIADLLDAILKFLKTSTTFHR